MKPFYLCYSSSKVNLRWHVKFRVVTSSSFSELITTQLREFHMVSLQVVYFTYLPHHAKLQVLLILLDQNSECVAWLFASNQKIRTFKLWSWTVGLPPAVYTSLATSVILCAGKSFTNIFNAWNEEKQRELNCLHRQHWIIPRNKHSNWRYETVYNESARRAAKNHWDYAWRDWHLYV